MGRSSIEACGISRRVFLRATGAAVTTTFFLVLLAAKLDDFDLAAIRPTLGSLTFSQWSGAVMATFLSFAAIGWYDTLYHRWLGTGVSRSRAFLSGASAIAIAQTAGLGLITGTIARWRGLPELSMHDAMRLTHYVSFSFMAALGGLAATVSAASLDDVETPAAPGLAIAIATTLLLAFLSLRRPRWVPFAIPPLGLMLRQIVLAALDIAFAATALFVLLPDPSVVDPALLLAAFVVSLGAALLSGVPGGVGPFELCLIALLPSVPDADLIAAVLAFRLIYYILPACLAVLWIVFSRPAKRQKRAYPLAKTASARAETQSLARLPGHDLVDLGGTVLHIAPASQAMVAIGDPSPGTTLDGAALDRFSQQAASRCLFPAFYKIGARSAAFLRQQGWSVIPISEEATLDLARFSLNGPRRRQMRRKLRQAEAAGVTIKEARQLPLSEMTALSEAWLRRRGGERGFSMGMFDPDTLPDQKCLLAFQNGRLVAFASFHHTSEEWALDLIRSGGDAPDGTMHTLIVAAAGAARNAGAIRLSLAALPLAHPGRVLGVLQDMDGLRQFKLSFGPQLRPLYLAASSPAKLGLAGADILLRIRYPDTGQKDLATSALQWLQTCLSKLPVVSLAVTHHIRGNTETRVARR